MAENCGMAVLADELPSASLTPTVRFVAIKYDHSF
jgi:hypothetical protein